MKIELNIHHTCTSVVEFTKLSTAIAALLSEFSAGVVTSAPLVAPTVSRNDVTTPVPPAPVTRTADTTAPMVADVAAPAETSNLPAAFSAALAEPPKRKRRTKAEMAAAAAANGGVADAGADEDATEETPTPPVIAAKAPVVDIFAPASPVPTVVPAPTPVAVPTPKVTTLPDPTVTPTPAAAPTPLTTSAESRASLKAIMLGLFMKEGGEAKVEQILQKYGGAISNIPDDKIGECAVDLNAALRG